MMPSSVLQPDRGIAPPRVDPVTLEIVRNGLKAVAQRITRRMIRSANSFIVKEMEDCSASILDTHGQLLAEEAGPPIQLNTVGICLKTILEHYFPLEAWKPGDVVITNDPYAGGESLAATHTNDYLAFHPLFFEGRLVAFSGLMVHHFDIGGMNMGTRGWGTEIYQEGLRIPPLKIVEGTELDTKVMDIILTNTRTRDMLENDVISQIASVKVAADDVLELFRKYGAQTMQACFTELINYSERRTREVLAEIPDGIYRHQEPLLDDGAKGGPYYLRLAIIKQGSDVTLDFSGTDAQVKGPINSPLATTLAAVYYAMRCVTDASIPSTEGCKRPIHVIAPPGTLVNARAPAAVYQRMIVCHTIVDLVMGALAQAIPERVMADSCGCLYNYTIATQPGSGARTVFGEVVPGGIGATARADGIEVVACHVTNCHIPPSEAIEMESPVLYLRREMRCDSGGAGRFRGGVGQILSYKILGGDPELQHTSQKSVSLPQGVAGGHAGDGGRWVINEGLPGERQLQHAIGDIESLAEGDTVTHYTPGGGGYGDPFSREVDAVRRDVRSGFISLACAERDYGIRFDAKNLDVVELLR
ncbi:hydantoinase B/oxoprolinase family protein [Paralcaligenes sp. KSB-10]|uniref:hydantoinase B/oxoprolinase family protein n=1 Tax=Paralcaligenes sp. KSB-10 TaxID=2901142 RepID=UPI001E4D3576|nr:hydantoinase B/oxoprolinase family protein [Paralcaligenes sp. KSB-10]UHL65404.1 hydantoinase B/oxoprolinase family protein [Paralcaligenes sp. KSB-10]